MDRNQVLTGFQNRMLGTNLSEFHTGYRLYSTAALAQLPFEKNTNDFHFDTEIIIQFLLKKLRIVELPIPTHYGDEVCHVNGLKYAWDVFKSTVKARLAASIFSMTGNSTWSQTRSRTATSCRFPLRRRSRSNRAPRERTSSNLASVTKTWPRN